MQEVQTMKVTKTIEIKFPWKLEGDDHGWTMINDNGDGTYTQVNKFSNHRVCEKKTITEKEVQELVNMCFEITRVTEF